MFRGVIVVLACVLVGHLPIHADDAKSAAPQQPQKAAVKSLADDPAGYRHPVRTTTNNIVTLVTTKGNLTVELYRDVAPAHADSFLARVLDSFYVKTNFHRIIDGFMIQGGDPLGTGMGSASYRLNAEFSQLKHTPGTLSMARSNDVNSASCQFFICLGSPAHLNGQYTIFGHLLKGYDVLFGIGSSPVVGERPKEKIEILATYQSDAEGNKVSRKK